MSHNNTFKEIVQSKEYLLTLGPYASYAWKHDPKHLFFMLARYKFCSKMLLDHTEILEVGCGDGTGMQLLVQNGSSVHGIDIFDEIIENNIAREISPEITYSCHNIVENPMDKKFDAAYSLDVIEHISNELEDDFVKNISLSLKKYGVCIIGTPNITASMYASEGSKKEHINLKSHDTLKQLMKKYFNTVFLFSMNDEVVHTGFYPMAHFLFAVCIDPKLKT